MTVIINGTTGVTSVNGSAAAPSVTGTDTDTGIVYGTNTLSLATGGTTALTANSSQGIQVLNTIGVGNATPSTSGAGISFPATQSASSNANTLDDYEEGTFDPTFTSSGTTPTGISYTTQRGAYVKIGRLVTFNIVLNATWGNSPTGNFYITGLPFTPADSDQTYGTLNINYYASITLPAGKTQLSGEIGIASDSIAVYACGSTGGGAACQITSNVPSGFYFQATGSYMAAT